MNDEDGILEWARKQGFWLEHVVADAANNMGMRPTIGSVYLDPITKKLRDIDVAAQLLLRSDRYCFARWFTVECYAGEGDWVIRRADLGKDAVQPRAIASDVLLQFLEAQDTFRRILWPGNPVPFSILTTGKVQVPFDKLQQAVSAALGLLSRMEHAGAALVYPIVVTTAHLASLTYDGDAPRVTPEKWVRVLFSGSHVLGGSTFVDVVGVAHLGDYLLELRSALEDVCFDCESRGWAQDPQT